MKVQEKVNPHHTSCIKYREPWVQGSKFTCFWEQTDF